MNNIFLILENGAVFGGKSIGARAEVTGEVVFTTGMTGYMETLTDPSYYGQIVVQTFPQIGNYGLISEDAESRHPRLKAYVVYDLCDEPSNFRCEGKLEDYLKTHGIVGISGADTRSITKLVREHGVMNGRISYVPYLSENELAALKQHKITKAAEAVSCTQAYTCKSKDAQFKVALIDYGAKRAISRCLCERGCEVIVLPASTTAEEILALNPDGILLSNGPGNPADNTECIEQLRHLIKHRIPTFGICLGHQLLALTMGAKTEKLKYGHRGTNQPVEDIKTGKLYITSQNHGYAVINNSIPTSSDMQVSFINANDKTCEGIDYPAYNAFTVQFHPEAAAGPHDTRFLFDRFIGLMKEGKKNAAR
ncbi:MAG: glutamine-hydrolyzing carbamoyl-phosphate synthase small subunit [Clostridiales bacterium]|nr:glutamine-hydrolyzing carbamoyl-phosphate synthase small subunit [Clostridiales bacterium]